MDCPYRSACGRRFGCLLAATTPDNVDELKASHLCTEEAQARTDEFAEVFDNTLRMCYYFKAKLLLVHLKQSQAYCLVFIHYRFH